MKAFLFFVATISATGLFAEESDFSYQETVEFHVKRHQGQYVLSSEEQVKSAYLSKRSLRVQSYTISEPAYAALSNLTAKLGTKKINEKHFSFFYPDYEDVFLQDTKIHAVHFPKIEQGDEISYSFERSYSDVIFLPIVEVPNIDQLEQFKLIINHPKHVKVNFTFFFPGGPVKYIEEPMANKTVLTFGPLAKRSALSYFPFDAIHAAVLIRLFDGQGAINGTSVRSFTEWYQGKSNLQPLLSELADDSLRSSLSAASSAKAKLRLIHNFVRKNIRYIADERSLGAFIPREPGLVLQRRYGDCKDRAYLVSAIARNYGIDVNMALVSSKPAYDFEGAVHIGLFDHVICHFDDNGRDVFFDPTARYCEFGNLPEDDIGERALILNPANPRFRMVGRPNELPSIELNIRASLDDLKNGEAEVILRNDFRAEALRAEKELRHVELENYISNLITSFFYKISIDYFAPKDRNEDSITFNATADLSRFVIPSPKRMYVPQTPFILLDNDILEREADEHAIYFAEAFRARMNLHLETPGHQPKAQPIRIGSGAGASFSAKPIISQNVLEVNYDITLPNKKVEGTGKARLLGFCKDYFRQKRNLFALERID